MIISALICGVVFTGCSSDKTEVQDEKTMGELYVIGARSATVSANKTDLVFTGDDIESFNVNTGEIVFTKVKADDIRYRIGLYSLLYFYLNDEPLFDPPLRIHSEVSSIMDVLGLSIFGSKIYFHKHTQNYDFMPAAEREALEKEQDELVQKRQKEMETFIKYLSDEGKIDNTGGTELPPDEDLPCTDVACTEVFVYIPLKLEYPNGQPVLLDTCKVFWVSQNRFLEQNPVSWNEARIYGCYVIVDDMMRKELENKQEVMRFTGYLNGEIVCEREVLVGADCCHVNYLGTEPLTQVLHNISEKNDTLRIGKITEIELGRTVENAEYGISLRVKNIYESRCPIGVMCVWEGNASVELQLTTPKGTYNFTLDTHYPPNFKNDTVIEGIKYQLRNVLPYPVHGKEPPTKIVRILVDDNENVYDEYFNAIVIGKGLDCGNSFLIQFDNDVTGLPSPYRVYYEINLPEKYKIKNERISVKFRVPNDDEIMVCTTMGAGYPHIYIVDVR